jgi:Uma2 family endonuclease
MASTAAPITYRFTRDDYHRMGEAGLFRDERVELLNGEVLTMSPKLTPHAYAVNQLTYALITQLGSTAIVRIQDPIVLDNWSEPEPDIAVCLPTPDRYKQAHPTAAQVLIVIEVADTSLFHDRLRKARAYAASGIPEYWIVNLVDQQIEVHTLPDSATSTYRHRRDLVPGDTLALAGGSTLMVSDILP